MAFTCVSRNSFKEGYYFSHLVETKRFIITVRRPTFSCDKSGIGMTSANKIAVYDKRMNFIREILFYDYPIEKIMVKSDEDTIAIACPLHHRLVLIDLQLDHMSEVQLYKWPDFREDEEDVDEQGLYPSLFYWWTGDFLYVYTIYNYIYRIDTSQLSMSIIDEIQLQNECPELNKLILAASRYSGILWLLPHTYQFTYFNGERVGFVDLKNEVHHAALYIAPDVHSVYFYINTFIVLNCYSIELVKEGGIAKAYALSKESNRMESSLFIAEYGQIIVVDSRWTGSNSYDSLLVFLFDGNCNSYSEKEKEFYRVIQDLSDNFSDVKACLRLILMEEFDDSRLSIRWFDLLLYNKIETAYTLLIIARTHVGGNLYNSLRLARHEDAKIMSAVKFAMSRYLKGRGDMKRYEENLLKSIEYYSENVKSLAELGKLYLAQGRYERGIFLIKKALRNIKIIYDTENSYDKYDIDQFVNRYFIGNHMMANERLALLSVLRTTSQLLFYYNMRNSRLNLFYEPI